MKHTISLMLCVAAMSCVASSDSSPSASGGASGGYAQSDLSGSWIGKLTPADPSEQFRLFYFNAAVDGLVSEAADSVGHEWHDVNANIVADLLASGELSMSLSLNLGLKKLQLHGQMTDSMANINGEYQYSNVHGVSVNGAFELHLSEGDDYFTNLDYSGSWSGGFGVGRLHNQRLLTFELDQAGNVVSGTLMNTVTGEEIHHYSAGSGNFSVDNAMNGRIDNFVLVGDDGSFAECDFLLVDINLELIAGIGTDSEVGAAVIEVRR